MLRFHISIIMLIVAALLLSAGCTQTASAPNAAGSPGVTQLPAAYSGDQKLVRLETTMGNITIALHPAMPITTGHFVSLVEKGFYNGVTFHRVIDKFMIQGGDRTGTGSGGSGPNGSNMPIKDEFTANNQNNRGTIAMANSGPDTGDSQFFINLVNNNYLDTKHPVFGKVVEGMEVVDAIGKTRTGAGNRPVVPVTIIRAEVI
jgi:peptidylprolyl isomerase